MGLRKDRKGTVAMMDALFFIILITMAAGWLFSFYDVGEEEEPMAKRISDDLFMVEVRTCDLMDLKDTKVLPIATIGDLAYDVNEPLLRDIMKWYDTSLL